MKILTLDIATIITGFAYFKNNNLEKSGILIKRNENIDKRVMEMTLDIESLIKKFMPDVIVVEAPFFGIGRKGAAIKASKIHGVVEFLAYKYDIKYVPFTSTQWRKLIGIKNINTRNLTDKERKENRERLKKESITIAKRLNPFLKDDNEADAICLGIAYNLTEEKQ